MDLDLSKLNTKYYDNLDEVSVGDIVLDNEAGPEVDVVVQKDPDDDTVYLLNNGWEELEDVAHIVDNELETIDLDNIEYFRPVEVKVLSNAKEKTEPVYQWRDELDDIVGKQITVTKTGNNKFEFSEDANHWGMLTRDSIKVVGESLNAKNIYLGKLQSNKTWLSSTTDERTEQLLERMTLFDLTALSGENYRFSDGTLFKFMTTEEGEHLGELFFNDPHVGSDAEQRLQSHDLLNIIFDKDNTLCTVIEDVLKELTAQLYVNATEYQYTYSYQIKDLNAQLVQDIQSGKLFVLPIDGFDKTLYHYKFTDKEITEIRNNHKMNWLNFDKFKKD